MNSKFAFKLTAILLTFVKLMVLSYPFTFALVNLKQGKFKYGYDFFELNYKAAFIISVAISIVFSVWNAFEFEKFKKVSLDQYLKSKQRYKVKIGQGETNNTWRERLESMIASDSRLTLIHKDEGSLQYSRKSKVQIKDLVSVKYTEGEAEITSKPRFGIWFIDLGRNYKNVQQVAKALTQGAA